MPELAYVTVTTYVEVPRNVRRLENELNTLSFSLPLLSDNLRQQTFVVSTQSETKYYRGIVGQCGCWLGRLN